MLLAMKDRDIPKHTVGYHFLELGYSRFNKENLVSQNHPMSNRSTRTTTFALSRRPYSTVNKSVQSHSVRENSNKMFRLPYMDYKVNNQTDTSKGNQRLLTSPKLYQNVQGVVWDEEKLMQNDSAGYIDTNMSKFKNKEKCYRQSKSLIQLSKTDINYELNNEPINPSNYQANIILDNGPKSLGNIKKSILKHRGNTQNIIKETENEKKILGVRCNSVIQKAHPGEFTMDCLEQSKDSFYKNVNSITDYFQNKTNGFRIPDGNHKLLVKGRRLIKGRLSVPGNKVYKFKEGVNRGKSKIRIWNQIEDAHQIALGCLD